MDLSKKLLAGLLLVLMSLASGCGSSEPTFGDQVLVVFTEHAQSNYIIGAVTQTTENETNYISGIVVKKGSNYNNQVKFPKDSISGVTVFDNVFDYERKFVGSSFYHPSQVGIVENQDIAIIHVEGKMSSYRVRSLVLTNYLGLDCITGVRFNRGFGEGKRVYIPKKRVYSIQFFDTLDDYKKARPSQQRTSLEDLEKGY